MRRVLPLALACFVTLAAGAAFAESAAIPGGRLSIVDPTPTDPSRRSVVFAGGGLGASVTGDPTTSSATGALLQLVVDGTTPSDQTFTLAQGVSAGGKPFWRAKGPSGFSYVDKRGERGPVRTLTVKTSARGAVRVKAVIRGGQGPLDVVPPNTGTQAWALLTLGAGDRLCIHFGPSGVVRRNDATAFKVARTTTATCPAVQTGSFLALSYNVAGLPEGLSGSHPAVNTALIAPLLNGYDLVLMQETWKTPDPNPLAPLRVYHEILEAGALHPFKTPSAPQPNGTDPRRPTALVADGLNAFSRYPIAHLERHMWNLCVDSAADCLSQKGFSLQRITFAPGVTVDVYDLHNEAGGTPEDDVARDLDVTQLSTFIQTFSADSAVIVGGDFNLHTNEEPDSTQFQRLLAETGLADVCATLSCPSPGRIDKFLFRSHGAVALAPQSWRFETDVFQDGNGDPLSDHDALAVRFSWSVVP